MAELNKLKT